MTEPFLLNRHERAVILTVPKKRAAEAALNILLKFGFYNLAMLDYIELCFSILTLITWMEFLSAWTWALS